MVMNDGDDDVVLGSFVELFFEDIGPIFSEVCCVMAIDYDAGEYVAIPVCECG